jgi:hypothetical protein
MKRDSADLAPDSTDVPTAPVVWRIERLVELIDAAIDSAGAQLARSAGLWADSPSPYHQRERPVRQRQHRPSDTRAVLEQEDPARDIGPV